MQPQRRRTELSPVAKASGDDSSLGGTTLTATPKRALHYAPGLTSTPISGASTQAHQQQPRSERQWNPQARSRMARSIAQNLTERALQTPVSNPVSPPSYGLSLSPAAGSQDTGGFLSITSDDDLWLPRYTEPIPLQSEDGFKEMSDRIDAILSCPVTPNARALNPRRGDQLSTSPYNYSTSPYGNDGKKLTQMPSDVSSSLLFFKGDELADRDFTLGFAGDSNEKAWGEGPGVPGGEEDSTPRRHRHGGFSDCSSCDDDDGDNSRLNNSNEDDKDSGSDSSGSSSSSSSDSGSGSGSSSSSGSSDSESPYDNSGYGRKSRLDRKIMNMSTDSDPYSTAYSMATAKSKKSPKRGEESSDDDNEDVNDVEYDDGEANGYEADYRRAEPKKPAKFQNDATTKKEKSDDNNNNNEEDEADPYNAPYKERTSNAGGYDTAYSTPYKTKNHQQKPKSPVAKVKTVKATVETKPANPLAREGSMKINLEGLHRQDKKVVKRSPRVHEVLDWNKKFQESIRNIGELTLNTHAEYRYRAYKSLSSLAADFSFEVKTYAKIIISEVYLPNDKKTIKPIRESTGEYGDKYIVGKIMFKFASDIKGIYGNDENAARIANHDLRSLVHVLNCWEPDVHVPMMTLVDYRGFRVVGMSLLPIDRTTIIHGSCDNGKTIHENPLLNDKLASVYKLKHSSHFTVTNKLRIDCLQTELKNTHDRRRREQA